MSVPNVLSIAGSDPSGGAGIQADLKTFAAIGVHGCAVTTALTAQNSRGVLGVWPVPAQVIASQLDALFDDVPIHAVKIGMLGTLGAVREVARALRTHSPAHVVLDPVLRASAGAALLADDAVTAMRDELLPLVTVVTPNVMEAGTLLGIATPRSVRDARRAAGALAARCGTAVLVTGGHLGEGDKSDVVDVLARDGTIEERRVARVPGAGAHGTGCVLSSALAAYLARGDSLGDACAAAQRFVAAAIANAPSLDGGQGACVAHPLGTLWGVARLGEPAGRV